MENEIKLLKNNDNRKDSDLEWVREFYDFLQGDLPESISIGKGHKPKMSSKKAMSIIWYLQEHFPVLPDKIERCSYCEGLYNSWSQGGYWESKMKHFCDGCRHFVPLNYDNSNR